MKLSQLTLALTAFTLAPNAFAGILTLEDSASRVNGITISKGGKMEVEGRLTNLVTVGAGLRSSLGGLVKVYVGELLVNDKNKYACSDEKSYESLKDLSGVAVKLSIQYSRVTEADLEKAFNDGFKANGVTVNADIQKFVDSVKAGGRPTSGAKLSFTGEKLADGSEVVTYENSANGKPAVSTHGGAGLVAAIFGLWLGKTNESGLQDLRTNFVTCQVK